MFNRENVAKYRKQVYNLCLDQNIISSSNKIMESTCYVWVQSFLYIPK